MQVLKVARVWKLEPNALSVKSKVLQIVNTCAYRFILGFLMHPQSFREIIGDVFPTHFVLYGVRIIHL